MSIALNLQGFPEYFDFTRRVATNKAKITCKSLYLQHSDHSRYDSTDLFRIIRNCSVRLTVSSLQVCISGDAQVHPCNTLMKTSMFS